MIFKDYDRACRDSALGKIVSLVSAKKTPACLRDYGYSLPETLGMELDVLPVNLYHQYQAIFPETKSLMFQLRSFSSVPSSRPMK